MKLFAIHSMLIDTANDNFILGDVKVFQTKEEAIEERNELIYTLKHSAAADFTNDDIVMSDDGFRTIIRLTPDSTFKIKIKEVMV